MCFICFFFNQKTSYEMRISDWSLDVCSSDLDPAARLYPVARRDGDLAVAGVQEQGGAGTEGAGERGLSRLLGDRFHAGRPASWHQCGFQGAGRCRACARDEGLRSEEHTSELQSLMRNSYAVFCLKKKNQRITT